MIIVTITFLKKADVCSMKQGLAIFMCFLFLSMSLKDVALYVSFTIHQDYITDNICVNNDVVDVMCFGRCYLTDQLDDKNTPNQTAENYKEIIVFLHTIDANSISIVLPQHQVNIKENHIISQSFISKILQPPQSKNA